MGWGVRNLVEKGVVRDAVKDELKIVAKGKENNSESQEVQLVFRLQEIPHLPRQMLGRANAHREDQTFIKSFRQHFTRMTSFLIGKTPFRRAFSFTNQIQNSSISASPSSDIQ